jgi:hypothetical protein
MKQFTLLACVILLYSCTEQKNHVNTTDPVEKIRTVMSKQEKAWNEGNIDLFMEGYWKSDSMQFISKTIQQGWQATLNRYKKSYPDLDAMGKLQFDIWQVVRISEDAYLVTGKYTLIRTNDQPSGPFTLIFRLKDGNWVITYDHTS